MITFSGAVLTVKLFGAGWSSEEIRFAMLFSTVGCERAVHSVVHTKSDASFNAVAWRI
jgi:hypothetical protein